MNTFLEEDSDHDIQNAKDVVIYSHAGPSEIVRHDESEHESDDNSPRPSVPQEDDLPLAVASYPALQVHVMEDESLLAPPIRQLVKELSTQTPSKTDPEETWKALRWLVSEWAIESEPDFVRNAHEITYLPDRFDRIVRPKSTKRIRAMPQAQLTFGEVDARVATQREESAEERVSLQFETAHPLTVHHSHALANLHAPSRSDLLHTFPSLKVAPYSRLLQRIERIIQSEGIPDPFLRRAMYLFEHILSVVELSHHPETLWATMQRLVTDWALLSGDSFAPLGWTYRPARFVHVDREPHGRKRLWSVVQRVSERVGLEREVTAHLPISLDIDAFIAGFEVVDPMPVRGGRPVMMPEAQYWQCVDRFKDADDRVVSFVQQRVYEHIRTHAGFVRFDAYVSNEWDVFQNSPVYQEHGPDVPYLVYNEYRSPTEVPIRFAPLQKGQSAFADEGLDVSLHVSSQDAFGRLYMQSRFRAATPIGPICCGQKGVYLFVVRWDDPWDATWDHDAWINPSDREWAPQDQIPNLQCKCGRATCTFTHTDRNRIMNRVRRLHAAGGDATQDANWSRAKKMFREEEGRKQLKIPCAALQIEYEYLKHSTEPRPRPLDGFLCTKCRSFRLFDCVQMPSVVLESDRPDRAFFAAHVGSRRI